MHKQTCEPNRTKIAKTTSQNVCAIGEKIARDNAGNALTEATFKGYDILYYVVVVDLRVPIIEVKLISEYVGLNAKQHHNLLSLTEKSKSVVAFIMKSNDSGPVSHDHILCIPNTWEEHQAAYRKENHLVLQMLRDHPDCREQYLTKIKQAYKLSWDS